MKSTFFYLVKPKEERYNNIKKIGDKELIVNSEISSYSNVSRQAIVVGLPTAFKTPVEEGDEVIVHHNVFRRWHDARGKERNSAGYIKEDLYKIQPDQVYAYKRIIKWKALPGYTFVKPLGELMGEVVCSDIYNEGDVIGYKSIGEYEFLIDDEKLYRVKNDFITIKYECQGNEKQYNKSGS